MANTERVKFVFWKFFEIFRVAPARRDEHVDTKIVEYHQMLRKYQEMPGAYYAT